MCICPIKKNARHIQVKVTFSNTLFAADEQAEDNWASIHHNVFIRGSCTYAKSTKI